MFISFEGIDGVGKSTQADLLETWLQGKGKTVVRTLEPGGTEVGVEIRKILLHHRGDLAPRAEAALFAADRAHHVATKIRPALSRGEIVITDRYFDSSVAYQGAGRELSQTEVRDLSLWAVGGLLPDLTVLLDLPADVARNRRNGSGTEPDRLESEKIEFFERARQAYLDLAKAEPNRFLVIDASATVEQMQQQIVDRVAGLI
ncbi:MAG: dTMP kinase [Microbacteriaceae bacterium]|nr:dTMP kinase [Micrococcales bacterium]NDC19645.1 dTMP kinase [Microbacteriaceae bacterium]